MTLIFPVFDRIELLPRFLAYYRKLGVDRFVAAVYNGAKNPLYRAVKAVVDEIRPSVICPLEQYNGPMETPGLNALRLEFVRPYEWFIIADLDEFIMPFPGHTFLDLMRFADEKGYEAISGYLVDRIASNGLCNPLDKRLLDEQFPLALGLTARYAYAGKVPILRGSVEIKSGHHLVDDQCRLFQNGVEVHHFKWTAGVAERMGQRLESFRNQKLAWAEESARFLDELRHGIDLTGVAKARAVGV